MTNLTYIENLGGDSYSRVKDLRVISDQTRIDVQSHNFSYFFSFKKVTSLSISHASLLSWSLAPELARPDVYSTSNRIPSLNSELDLILQREGFGQDFGKLVNAIAPNCTEFILECTVGTTVYTGKGTIHILRQQGLGLGGLK